MLELEQRLFDKSLYPEKFWQYIPLFERAIRLNKARYKLLEPRADNFYENRFRQFLDGFLGKERTGLSSQEGFLLVGDSRFFEVVAEHISQRRKEIIEISGKTPEDFIVFLGDIYDMWCNYRLVGSRLLLPTSCQRYPASILGGGDCFLNTRYLASYINPRLIKRACTHEPAHLMYNLILTDREEEPTFQLDCHKIIAEALAGPSDPQCWEDVNTRYWEIDPSYLERQFNKSQSDFWSWFENEDLKNYRRNRYPSMLAVSGFFTSLLPRSRNGVLVDRPPYIVSPVAALFCQWASQKGDEKFWLEKARSLE